MDNEKYKKILFISQLNFVKKFYSGAGALLQWLREETRNEEVVSSNPGSVDWMDIFHI